MNSVAQSRFLDLRALAALERMCFTTRRSSEGSFGGCGARRPQVPTSEFVDYREYSGGEDLRRLDWKILGRTGKAFVRIHEEESRLNFMLAIDTSTSMDFRGTDRDGVSKLQYAQYLLTAFAHLITRGQDQVGLALVDRQMQAMYPPGSTPEHLNQLYTAIEQIETRQTTTMAAGLRQLFERCRRGGVLLLASDYLMDDLEEAFGVLRLFRRRGWEIIILHLVHPEEERLPEEAAIRFEGMEGEGWVDCTPAEIRAVYVERFAAHLAMVRQMALAGDCDYRRGSTGTAYLRTLGGFLVERAGS